MRTNFAGMSLAAALLVFGASEMKGAETAPSATMGGVTYTKDVAPIVQRACQGCHRPGQIGPFSLLTYDETRPWAKSIKVQVVQRNMPPWYIDRTVGFHNS